VAQLRLLIERIRETTTHFPTTIVDDFQRQLGIVERREQVLHVVERFAVQALTAPGAVAHTDVRGAYARMVRTRSQVWGDLILSSVLAITLLLTGVLTASEVVSLLLEVGRSAPMWNAIAWTAGFAAPLTLIGLGALGWNLARGLRYANPAAAALPERRGQAVLWWVVIFAGVAATVTLVSMAIAVTYGRLPFVFGGLAVLQAGILIGFAGFLDRGAVAILHLSYLAWLVATRIAALLLAGFASLLELLCFVLRVGVRLLAIPGDVVRGRPMEPAVPAAR
jgi:hypothetical protein